MYINAYVCVSFNNLHRFSYTIIIDKRANKVDTVLAFIVFKKSWH